MHAHALARTYNKAKFPANLFFNRDRDHDRDRDRDRDLDRDLDRDRDRDRDRDLDRDAYNCVSCQVSSVCVERATCLT